MNNGPYNLAWSKRFGLQLSDCIDPKNIEALNRIVKATDCRIVISSSWRMNDAFRPDSFEWLLYTHGCSCKVIGATPIMGRIADEIRRYLSSCVWDSYVVLEDSTIPIDNLVKVNPQFGLTFEDADKAIEILNADTATNL